MWHYNFLCALKGKQTYAALVVEARCPAVRPAPAVKVWRHTRLQKPSRGRRRAESTCRSFGLQRSNHTGSKRRQALAAPHVHRPAYTSIGAMFISEASRASKTASSGGPTPALKSQQQPGWARARNTPARCNAECLE